MKKPKNLKKIIFILSAVIFVVSLGIIVNLCFIEPYQNASTLKEIEEVYYKEADSEEETGNLAALMAINSDIMGWIRINDTPINYPVLQSAPSDPIYYLYRNYKKEHSGFGSIFLDSLCDLEKPSKNLILYGHNMRDASMSLSTCSSELKEFRTVVVAREVREGESPEVDVENAKIRGNPLMPQGYYAKYGGKAPKINGFEKDLAEGKLTWYVEQ